MKILPTILALGLLTSGGWAEGDKITKDALDKDFRLRSIAFYQSEDFSTTDFQRVHQRIAEIARAVYGPHSAMLKLEAEASFQKISKVSGDQVVRVPIPIILPISDFMKTDTKSGDAFSAFLASGNGGIAYLNNLELQSACRMAVQMAVAQSQSKPELVGKRSILSGFAKDRVFRLNDDFLHPSIAIDSLGEWFFVTFDWMEQGFYFPNRIEWHKRGEQDGGGQPATRPESK